MQVAQSPVGKVLSRRDMRPPMAGLCSTRWARNPAAARSNEAWIPATPPPRTSTAPITSSAMTLLTGAYLRHRTLLEKRRGANRESPQPELTRSEPERDAEELGDVRHRCRWERSVAANRIGLAQIEVHLAHGTGHHHALGPCVARHSQDPVTE